MEISKEVLERVLKTPNGIDAYQGNSPLTVKVGLSLAANQLVQGRSPEDTGKAGKLLNRIKGENGSLHLKSEEVSFLKQMIAGSCAPSIYMQLYEVLEPDGDKEEDP